jgi:hypothetical protein
MNKGRVQTLQVFSTSFSFVPQVGTTLVHKVTDPPTEVVPAGQGLQVRSWR